MRGRTAAQHFFHNGPFYLSTVLIFTAHYSFFPLNPSRIQFFCKHFFVHIFHCSCYVGQEGVPRE